MVNGLGGQFGLGDQGSDRGGRGRYTPVAALDDGGGLVGLAGGEAAFFATGSPEEDRANDGTGETAEPAEFAADFLAERADLGSGGCVLGDESLMSNVSVK